MINERLKINWQTVDYTQVIYVTFNFGLSFIINTRIFMQEYVYISRFIIQQRENNCFMR